MRIGLVVLVAGIVWAPLSGSLAQQIGPACAGGAASLPPELAGWASRTAMDASADVSGDAGLALGVAVDGRLRRAGDVRYPVVPGKAAAPASYGGLFTLTIRQRGTYRVALGAGAWIDMVKVKGTGTGTVASTAHGHGPDCSDVRKTVDFPLSPGRYTLQIIGAPASTIALMVAPLP